MPRRIKEKTENDTKPKRVNKVQSSVSKDKVIIKYEPTELVIEWPKIFSPLIHILLHIVYLLCIFLYLVVLLYNCVIIN